MRPPLGKPMFYIYILQSLKDLRTYVGFTNSIEQRLKQHNSGYVRSTKSRIPLKLVHSESFETSAEAKKRELYWKSGAGRKKLKAFYTETNNHYPRLLQKV